MNHPFTSDTSRHSVEETIHRAWAHENYTTEIDESLRKPQGYHEAEEVQAEFVGKRWQEVSAELAHRQYPDRFMLPSAALVYYLPAFLIAALANPDDSLMECLIIRLTPPKRDAAIKEFEKCFSGLNVVQKRAVAAFLSHVREACASDPEYPLGTDAKYRERIVRRLDDAVQRFWGK